MNYREQNGCHNCKHVFIYEEYEEEDTYYCCFNAPPRPLCMSVHMGETTSSMRQEFRQEFSEANRAWEEWAKNRRVEAWGICEYYDNGVTSEV